MSIGQPCRHETPFANPEPTFGDGPLGQDLVLKTLKLHAAAINTGLSRLHALEQQVNEERVKPSPAANGQPVTPSPSAASDWLEAALKRWGPEDGNPFIYFFHIPKTSGSSFIRFLEDAFGAANMAPLRDWDSVVSYSGAAANWKVWTGHFGGMLPFILPSWPRIVTILRDPVDRTLSHINHVKRETESRFHRYAKGMSVVELCHYPKFRRQIDNAQARFLASLAFAQALYKRVPFQDAILSMDPQYGLLDSAICAMAEMDMVGIAEAHHQTLRLFAHVFNLPTPAQAYHVNKAEPSQLKRADLSPDELECIQELTQIDQLVYDCARKRFENECWRAKITPQL